MPKHPRYRIANWQTTQHYKDRNPPWVKLYKEILHSYWWVTLDDAGRALAIACMLIASENGNQGEFVADPGFFLQRAFIKSANFAPLLECYFIEVADPAESEPEAEEETETETDRELLADASKPKAPASKGKGGALSKRSTGAEHMFDEFWDAFGKKVGKGEAVKAWARAVRKAKPEDIIAAAKAQQGCRPWREGFQPHPATWLNREQWTDDLAALNREAKPGAAAPSNNYADFP